MVEAPPREKVRDGGDQMVGPRSHPQNCCRHGDGVYRERANGEIGGFRV